MVRQDIEEQILQSCRAGDYPLAATLLLEGYGSEIASLLSCRLRSEADAGDVFGMFCEDLWRALPNFEFRCSARTWAYVLARHAELRLRAEPQRRPDRNLPFCEQLNQLVEQLRTSTAPYERTQVQEQLRALRQRLGEEDELILLLRVDRSLGWQEIARVFLPAGCCAEPATVSPEALQREAARLRQRFSVIKERLRGWAKQEGLLPHAPKLSEVQPISG